MNTFKRAKQYTTELNAIREQIHRHPELGNREYRTAELVEKILEERGKEA